MTIHQRIKELLYKLDKSSTDLAKELDVTQSTITRTTKGDTLPSSKMLIPMGEKLNVNINWLLFGKGSMFMDGAENEISQGESTDSAQDLSSEVERLERENKQLREHLKDKEEIIRLLKKENV